MPPRIDTPCREWQGGVDSWGYGHIWRHGRNWKLHRWVWTLMNGPIPEGMKVLHRCDNPPCFRLDHLFLGTDADNAADREAKQRGGAGRRNAAKTHCPRGHEYTPENTRITRRGTRVCVLCDRERQWRRYHERVGH